MKEVLDDFSEDKVKLDSLIAGRRVQLAEDLSELFFLSISDYLIIR